MVIFLERTFEGKSSIDCFEWPSVKGGLLIGNGFWYCPIYTNRVQFSISEEIKLECQKSSRFRGSPVKPLPFYRTPKKQSKLLTPVNGGCQDVTYVHR